MPKRSKQAAILLRRSNPASTQQLEELGTISKLAVTTAAFAGRFASLEGCVLGNEMD
jgi:hypothetical protein